MNNRRVKPAVLAVARDLQQRIEQRIPNTETYLHPWRGDVTVMCNYNCPCGEVSGMDCLIRSSEVYMGQWSAPGMIENYVEGCVKSMRAHVRSEGNEPSF